VPRSLEDGACGAIVLFQQIHTCLRKILLKAQHVAEIRPTPAIDALVLITHAEQAALARIHQQFDQFILGAVGILKLVHQDVPVALLVTHTHIRMLAQELLCSEQEVVEVQSMVLLQQSVVSHKDAGCGLVPVGRRPIRGGRDQLILGA